jgi:hypothetical protein
MTRQFRVEVVGLLDGDLHSILWVRQDDSAIRCGLNLPGTDLHVTAREGEGAHHRGRGDAEVSVAGVYALWEGTLNPEGTEQLAAWVLADLKSDFPKFPTYKKGASSSRVILDLSSLPAILEVRVLTSDLGNLYLPQWLRSMQPRLVHLDTSDKPAVVLLVGTA